jgi:hypothetical protein
MSKTIFISGARRGFGKIQEKHFLASLVPCTLTYIHAFAYPASRVISYHISLEAAAVKVAL